MEPASPIGVVGTGYVGLVSAVCFAHLGHRVVCLDINEEKIRRLEQGEVPIYEPGLEKLIDDNRSRLRFTTSYDELLSACEVLFIAVDTPPSLSGDADLSRVGNAVREIAARDGRRLIIMKSTVPVGTGEKVKADLEAMGASGVAYVSNPEFLREGAAIQDFLEPDRIVIGADAPQHAAIVEGLYRGIDTDIVRTSIASAEMIKYASNAFLATKISFINEIANVCEATGADVKVVAHGMGLDHRIGPHFLQAGIGYGGSCFPKDVSALKQIAGNSGYHFQLLNAVIEVNELQKRRVIGKLKRHLGDELRGLRIALLGLAFKPNTDDIRQAASVVLASRLLAEGAVVVGYDPIAVDNTRALLPTVSYAPSAMEALAGADACVLVTEWQEFIDLDWHRVKEVMARPIVIDGRNALDGPMLVGMGFTYEGVGTRLRHL